MGSLSLRRLRWREEIAVQLSRAGIAQAAEQSACIRQVGVSITSSSPKYADAGDRTSGKARLARYPAREFHGEYRSVVGRLVVAQFTGVQFTLFPPKIVVVGV